MVADLEELEQMEEKTKKFFEESQTDSVLQRLFKMTRHGTMRKLKMISGLLQEISFVAITWNPESTKTCRKKNHFLFHRSTSTLPEQLIFRKEKGEFIFLIADGRIKPLGGDQDLRTSTLIRERPIRGESQVDFLGESEGSLPPPHDSFPDAGEAINEFWSMSGNFIYRHHVEPRVKLYVPREESFPIPLECLEVTITTYTTVDTLMLRQLELSDCYGHVSRDSLYGVTSHGVDIHGPGETEKKTNDLKARQIMAEILKHMSDASKRKRNKDAIPRNPKLDNATKLRSIYFIDPEDKDFQNIMMKARRILEIPMPAAMPCKTSVFSSSRETCRTIGERKTKYACIVLLLLARHMSKCSVTCNVT